VKRRLYIILILAVLGSSLSGKDLDGVFKGKTLEQIMTAMEPSIEMPEEKIIDQIKVPVFDVIARTFYLFISTCRSEKPDEKFQAFYGIPVSSLFGIRQHIEHIHHLGNITGQGPTARDALIDLVKKLDRHGIIDTNQLVEKLKSK